MAAVWLISACSKKKNKLKVGLARIGSERLPQEGSRRIRRRSIGARDFRCRSECESLFGDFGSFCHNNFLALESIFHCRSFIQYMVSKARRMLCGFKHGGNRPMS